eukprot:768208-Hanusia_phi.AAC.7
MSEEEAGDLLIRQGNALDHVLVSPQLPHARGPLADIPYSDLSERFRRGKSAERHTRRAAACTHRLVTGAGETERSGRAGDDLN